MLVVGFVETMNDKSLICRKLFIHSFFKRHVPVFFSRRHIINIRPDYGGGGFFDLAKVEIKFSDKGECQLPDDFFGIKNYCS